MLFRGKMAKKAKITIIGAGNVGATIGFSVMHKGIAGEILLIDIAKDKAEGEAMDLAHCADFCPPVKVRSGDYGDAEGSDFVVVAGGAARKPGQTRLELADVNVRIMRDIMAQIVPRAPDAVYVIVSNPVDVLTYAWIRLSGLPRNRVVGSGTMLDCSRLKNAVASDLSVDPRDVNVWVLGEHGDSSFAAWDSATVGGRDLREMYLEKGVPFDGEALMDAVRRGGAEVIRRKGSTFYAVAMSVATLIEKMVEDAGAYVSVSSILNLEGVGDVCVSLPCSVGSDGVRDTSVPALDPGEAVSLSESAGAVRKVLDSLNLA